MCKCHKGDKYAKCNPCRIDINVAREGKNDVTKLVTSENHKNIIAAKKRNERITSFMAKGPEESDKLVYAKTKFAIFEVKNNLPFSICNEFLKIVSDMFPSSELAKKCGAGKTKTSQSINGKRRRNLKIQSIGLPAEKRATSNLLNYYYNGLVYKDWDCCKNLNFLKIGGV